MASDTEIRADVCDELTADPGLDATHVHVAIHEGIVTLSGSVPLYAQKHTATRAARRVYGVRAVVDALEVRLAPESERDDEEIAEAAVRALQWDATVPDDGIEVTVERGHVTLEGTVEWRSQRDGAERAVRNLMGVRGLSNHITVAAKAAKVTPARVKEQIFGALRRGADVGARRIGVDAKDGKVVLHGNVRSWAEAEAAEEAAWAVPGVSDVENRISVTP